MKQIITFIIFTNIILANLVVGNNFPNLTLKNQFDKKIHIKQKGLTTLLLSFEKDVSSSIKLFLDNNKKFLDNNNILYISDISSMPAFITNFFAIPKMKKLDFDIALLYDEAQSIKLNKKDGKITIVKLKNGIIREIKYISASELHTINKHR